MSDTIVPLFGQPVEGKPSQSIISKIKHLLACAERGEVTALAYAYIRPNGNSVSGWETTSRLQWTSLIGSVALIQNDLMKNTEFEESEAEPEGA